MGEESYVRDGTSRRNFQEWALIEASWASEHKQRCADSSSRNYFPTMLQVTLKQETGFDGFMKVQK